MVLHRINQFEFETMHHFVLLKDKNKNWNLHRWRDVSCLKYSRRKKAWSTLMFSWELVSTIGMRPLNSFLLTNRSASRMNISFPSSFFVVTTTTGFLDIIRLFRIRADVSTCFSKVLFGTKLTSNTQMKPSILHFPSGINLWSNSFSIPESMMKLSSILQKENKRKKTKLSVTELIFADVHEFLSTEDPGGRAPLHVRLLLPWGSERLEGGVVYELGLLNNLR